MARRSDKAFTLIELLVVIGLMALAISILLPTLNRARETAMKVKLASEARQQEIADRAAAVVPTTTKKATERPMAVIKSFSADVILTPQLSVGTVEPESIYQAKFTAKLQAAGASAGESEIQLPLPPQIISLADLTVLVNGQVSESVTLRDDKLVWNGALPPNGSPAALDVTYTAMGRGIYQLQTPPSKILDQFKINLTASGSDVRVLYTVQEHRR